MHSPTRQNNSRQDSDRRDGANSDVGGPPMSPCAGGMIGTSGRLRWQRASPREEQSQMALIERNGRAATGRAHAGSPRRGEISSSAPRGQTPPVVMYSARRQPPMEYNPESPARPKARNPFARPLRPHILPRPLRSLSLPFPSSPRFPRTELEHQQYGESIFFVSDRGEQH